MSSLSLAASQLTSALESASNDTLPHPEAISRAADALFGTLPTGPLGEEATVWHLFHDITPGFNGPKTSSNYYGFVTGGVFPIAEVADNIVTAFDQNVQVHLPDQSISTAVEDRALMMLVELLNLGAGWEGKTFTTGATGANILGLACGREAVVDRALQKAGVSGPAVGELGLLAACMRAGVKEIQVLTTMCHSSVHKAASVVGLGRSSVKDIPFSKDEPWRLNIDLLREELERSLQGVLSIVVLSAGEVNTGRFATRGVQDMKAIRDLCDQFGAWLHIDGAFGFFARSLPEISEFEALKFISSGLELADSLAGDCHKMLNVPYDCGFFLTHNVTTLASSFQNPNAAYLSPGASEIASPLNIGLENSRRFRALPVYSVLLAYGRSGLAEMFARQVRLARSISTFIDTSGEYELLNRLENEKNYESTHIIVLFKANDDIVNGELVKRINATRKMYVSGTKWNGKPACRIAVSTWKVDVEKDSALVKEVLENVLGP